MEISYTIKTCPEGEKENVEEAMRRLFEAVKLPCTRELEVSQISVGGSYQVCPKGYDGIPIIEIKDSDLGRLTQVTYMTMRTDAPINDVRLKVDGTSYHLFSNNPHTERSPTPESFERRW